jgi:hypothetical protein
MNSKFEMQRKLVDSVELAESAMRDLNKYLANYGHTLTATEAENVAFLIEHQREAVYKMRMAQAAVELLKAG